MLLRIRRGSGCSLIHSHGREVTGALDVSRPWTRGVHAGRARAWHRRHRLQNEAIRHGVSKANWRTALDMTNCEEKDAGEQSTVQTHCRAHQLHGHHGTHVARACK